MMKNRGELRKLIVIELILIVLFLAGFSNILYRQYRAYTTGFNEKISAVIGRVQEKYPQVNERELIEILNGKQGGSEELFRKYGINLEKESAVLENDEKFQKYVLIDTFFLLVFLFLSLGLFFGFNHHRDRKIDEITSYLEEINRGNYSLDISDNSEESLSILKNELYKTTVMLNEAAENSRKDKVLLKDSLSDISHQLKTPLTSIMIMLDAVLDDGNMDEKTRTAFLRDMKREITGTQFLVESLLKLSRLDSNTVKFAKQEAAIEAVVAEAVKNVEIIGELKNVAIKVSGNAERQLFCDFKWQVEALTNIIKNCIEHSGEDGEIQISYADNALSTEVMVRDFGSGIEPEDLPHIFERFYKGKHSGKDSVGIGLALAKAIIEKDNGYIQADSQAGKGTRFTIRYFR